MHSAPNLDSDRVSQLLDIIKRNEEYLKEHVTVPYSFAPATCHIQRATSVAALGEVLYAKGVVESAREHKPDYLRLSQAERERAEKERDFKIC